MTAGSAPHCLSGARSAPITSASPPALAHGVISAATIAIFTYSPKIFLRPLRELRGESSEREARRKKNDYKATIKKDYYDCLRTQLALATCGAGRASVIASASRKASAAFSGGTGLI